MPGARLSGVGHKTESIYRRHAIVDEAMLREGAAKLSAFHDTAHENAATSAKVVTIGRTAAGER